MRCVIKMDLASQVTEPHAFGARDRMGRPVGALIARFTARAEPNPTGYGYELNIAEAGVVYGYRPQATRQGVGYGASQSARYFATEAEREQAIGHYLVGARKRAAKLVEA